MEGGCAAEVSAAGRQPRSSTQVRRAAAHAAPKRWRDLPRAVLVAGREEHRVPVQRKLHAWRGVHRPLARGRRNGQAHNETGKEHLRSQLRRAAIAVLPERILARWTPARVHGAARRARRPLFARREVTQGDEALRSAARGRHRSELVP